MQEVAFNVVRPALTLSFVADLVSVAADGKTAVAVSTGGGSGMRGPSGRPDQNTAPVSRVAVVDLATILNALRALKPRERQSE